MDLGTGGRGVVGTTRGVGEAVDGDGEIVEDSHIGRQCPQYGERGHNTAGSTQMTMKSLTHLNRRFKLEAR